MENDFLTIDELAEKWRVPKSWVYARTRQKGPEAIPVIKVGKYCRFSESDVMEWLERKQEKQSFGQKPGAKITKHGGFEK